MAENKAKGSANKTKATTSSVSEFIAALPDETKRADAKTLIKMMTAATGKKPKLWGPSIVGFGSHHYVYASGREGDTPVVAFSPRKPALVLYLSSGEKLDKVLLDKLGKYKKGAGCMYIKKLADVDLAVLDKLIAQTVARRA
jgi:Domain of unknown function (DU1801)